MQFVGEKAQFVKSVLKSGTGGVGFYFHVKTGGNEPAVNLIAFQFGKVDAIGGKAAERFVQRGGNRFDPEHAGGDEAAAVVFGNLAFAADDEKTGGIVVVVFDVVFQYFQPLDFGRQS